MEMYVGSVERIAYYTEVTTAAAAATKTKDVGHGAANECNSLDETLSMEATATKQETSKTQPHQFKVMDNDDVPVVAAVAAAIDDTAALNDVVVDAAVPSAAVYKVSPAQNKVKSTDQIDCNDANIQRMCNGVLCKFSVLVLQQHNRLLRGVVTQKFYISYFY